MKQKKQVPLSVRIGDSTDACLSHEKNRELDAWSKEAEALEARVEELEGAFTTIQEKLIPLKIERGFCMCCDGGIESAPCDCCPSEEEQEIKGIIKKALAGKDKQ